MPPATSCCSSGTLVGPIIINLYARVCKRAYERVYERACMHTHLVEMYPFDSANSALWLGSKCREVSSVREAHVNYCTWSPLTMNKIGQASFSNQTGQDG
jgi:hypothetical protein